MVKDRPPQNPRTIGYLMGAFNRARAVSALAYIEMRHERWSQGVCGYRKLGAETTYDYLGTVVFLAHGEDVFDWGPGVISETRHVVLEGRRLDIPAVGAELLGLEYHAEWKPFCPHLWALTHPESTLGDLRRAIDVLSKG